VAAPVLLVGGWSLAQALQPPGFDPARETISALAATGTPHRVVMTAALLGTGLAHATTALALRPAAAPGRVALALAGIATVLVALLPLPSREGASAAHTVAASTAFAALAVWPAMAATPGPAGPVALRRTASVTAGLLLLGLVACLLAQMRVQGDQVGLAERVAAGAQALWPLVVVLSCRRAASRA
jgi:hypothetical membrane protein